MPKPNLRKLVENLPPFDGRLAGDLTWAMTLMREVTLDRAELSQEDTERLYKLIISMSVGFTEIINKRLLESPIFNENRGPLH
jgi:hypothetical protein